ncbi:MAG: amidohydrolase family protein [Woeseia sp.]
MMKQPIKYGVLVHIACIGTITMLPPHTFAADPTDTTFSTTADPRRVRIPTVSSEADPIIVLKGGTLIDGTGSGPTADMVLVIQGSRILEAGPANEVEMPQGEFPIIDVSGLYVIPGLIDLHIHLAQQWKADDSRYVDSDAAAAIRGIRKLSALLDGGITTVRDVGTRNDVALKVKEAVERRIFEGPRVYSAGKGILARGGHGDEIRSGASEASKGTIHSGGPYGRVANGATDWTLAVREQIRENADLIKLFAPFSRDEVSAAVTEAHMQGFRVTVDAFGKYTTWAVEAGADSIEHTLATPDEAIELMHKHGTALVPTLTTYHTLLTEGIASAGVPPGGYYHDLHRSFDMTHEGNLQVVRKAHEAGVKIGVGTDMGFAGEEHYPGAYFVEMAFLKDAGLDDADVLASATRIAAEILGMEDRLGTLEKGKLADVLVVRANPLVNIQNVKEIELVIANGRVVRRR